MKAYTAVVGPRDGEWFPVEVPEVPGVFTQGRDLVEVEAMAREAIAMALDVPISEVAVRIEDRRYQVAQDVNRSRESMRELLDAHVAENGAFTAEELAETREALYGEAPG